MSDHKTDLVPIRAWCYSSPDVRYGGKDIDVGLFAESLIYYDQILLNVGSPSQFTELIRWLLENDSYKEFIKLLKEGIVNLHDFAYTTHPAYKDGSYSVQNLVDPIQAQPDTFEQRYLYTKGVEDCIKKARHRDQLYKAIRGNTIEMKVDAFKTADDTAMVDIGNAQRHTLMFLCVLTKP